MKTKTIYTRRKSRAGILAAGLLAGGLLLGGTGAGFELAAPSPPAVHAAQVHADTASWPQPGQPGGGPVTSTPAKAGGTHSHTLLKAVGRMALRHVFHVHGFYIRRPHVLPYWLRRNY